VRWLAALAFVLGAGAPSLVSCTSGLDAHEPPPASSSERAVARDERAARKRALEQQGERDDTAPAPKPPPPPPPEPMPSASASASASADVSAPDAGAPSDAGANADAGVDAAAPDDATLCKRLCERAVSCATRAFDDAPALPPEVRRRMEESIREGADRCIEQCGEEVATKPERASEARACLAKPDCDAFLACVKALVGDG
jgi:hypothetical protein